MTESSWQLQAARERFELKVDKSGDCWPRSGRFDRNGYAVFGATIDGVHYARAHRFAWFLASGEHPVGRRVKHSCNTPPCVRPNHLYLTDSTKLVQDDMVHGRVSTYTNRGCRCDECRAALRAHQRKYYDPAGSSGKKRKEYELRYRLKRFGITVERYDKLLADQGGGCAICQEPPAKPYGLAVDHDHATGRVRGLLCNGCNLAIGNMRDRPSLLRAGADYLEERSA